MNFKLKALVAAVAMAASMSASADVAMAQSGNGEMTFQIWDATVGSESSYTFDTGATLTSIFSGVSTNSIWTYDFAADTTYTNWLGSLSAAAQSGLQWNVSAGDNVGAQAYLTTAQTTFDNFTGSTSFTNSQARSLGTALDIYLGGVNAATPGTSVATNSSVQINGKANVGYAGNLGGNWGNKQTLINTAGFMGTVSNVSELNKIAAVATGGASTPSTWTQQKFGGNDYTAKFNGSNLVISAVPEADTSAMMLAGLGLMGFIARRRSSKVA